MTLAHATMVSPLETADVARPVSTATPAPPLLVARGLAKTFKAGKKRVEAVRDVSLSLAPSQIVAFLGPNGAGKTTTIKMIAGLVCPDRGSVEIEGCNPHRDRRPLAHVGAVLEGNRNVYWRLSAAENIEYFGVLRGLSAPEARRRATELLERFGLADRRDAVVQTLSRGMQQKVAFAVALAHRPRLLLLDEPTLGLDVESAEAVKQTVRRAAADGAAILLTTHQLELAETIADRVAIIDKGTLLVHSATADLLAKYAAPRYVVLLAAAIDPSRRAALEALGARPAGNRVEFTGADRDLYRLLDVLRPVPILKLQRDHENLTDVFLKLIRGGVQ